MTPETPVIPGYENYEVRLGVGQPEYVPLPALPILEGDSDERGLVLTRWQPDDEDRQRILEGGSIYVWVYTFKQPLQPIAVSTVTPEVVAI